MADETKTEPQANPAPPAKALPAKQAAGKKGETITVRGPEDGRRRGGLTFGPIDTVVDLSTITPDQLAAIKGDASLSVKA